MTTAVKTGCAAVLICSAVVVLVWRVFVDAVEMLYGQPFGFPDSRFLGMMAAGIAAPFFLIGVPAFTLYLTLHRCRNRRDGWITAGVALYFMVVPLLMSFVSRKVLVIYYLCPAVLLGKLTGSSIGWYMGAALQLVLGAWLLGVLGQGKCGHKQAAT